jgi:hypothetical protein
MSATIKTPKRAIAVAKVLSPMERPPSVATLNTANPGAIPAVELGKCAANAYRHLISEAGACACSQAPPARRGSALQNRFRHPLAFPLRFYHRFGRGHPRSRRSLGGAHRIAG